MEHCILLRASDCSGRRSPVDPPDLHGSTSQAAVDGVPGRAATPATPAAPARRGAGCAKAPVKVQTEIDNGQLKAPTAIPKKIAMIKEDEAPPPSGGVVGGVPGGVPGGQMGGVVGGVLGSIVQSAPVAVPKVATPKRVPVSSGVVSGLLIHKVQPTYPPLAKQARISGAVILQAVIGKDGSIQKSESRQWSSHAYPECSRRRATVEVQALHSSMASPSKWIPR